MHHSSGAAAVSTEPKYLLPPGELHNYYKHEVAQRDSRDNFCLFHSLPLAFYVMAPVPQSFRAELDWG